MDTNPVLLNKLSMDSDIPLYSQLVSIIKRNISAGTLPPGALLPSEAELCRTFDVSRSTVRQAIGALEAEGLVVRKQGARHLRRGAEDASQDRERVLVHERDKRDGDDAVLHHIGV